MPKRDRRRGISRLPAKTPTRWRAGFPWAGLDYRSQDARFLGHFIACVVSDHGGADNLSRTQMHNIERSAYLALKITQFECGDLVPNGPPGPAWTPAEYLGAVKMTQRLLENLGPGRRAREVGLREYLEQAAQRTESPQETRSASGHSSAGGGA